MDRFRKYIIVFLILLISPVFTSCRNGQKITYKCQGAESIVRYTAANGKIVEEEIDPPIRMGDDYWEKTVYVSTDIEIIQLLVSPQQASSVACSIYVGNMEVLWEESDGGLMLYLTKDQIQHPEKLTFTAPALTILNKDAPDVCSFYLEKGPLNADAEWKNDLLLGRSEMEYGESYQIRGLPIGKYSLLAEDCKGKYMLGVGNSLAYSGEDATLSLYRPGDRPANGFGISNESSRKICKVVIDADTLDEPVNVLTPNSIINENKMHIFGVAIGPHAPDVILDFSVIACDGASMSVKNLKVPNMNMPILTVTDELLEKSAVVDGSANFSLLRFDGIYYVPVAGYFHYLRFYKDGTVVDGSFRDKPEKAVDRIKKDGHEFLAEGEYVLFDDGRLDFTTSSSAGSVKYYGIAKGNQLELHLHSHINDFQTDYVYNFYEHWDLYP